MPEKIGKIQLKTATTNTKDNMLDKKQRTKKQNDSLHLMFDQLANSLNGQGYDVRIVLQVIASKGVDMMWSGELVKELLWRPIQKKYLDKHSTKDLNSIGEITEIYDMLNKFLGQNFFVHVDFPSLESLINKQDESSNSNPL